MNDAEKFRGKYRIPAARLKHWDYGAAGLYFVTICTFEMQHYFGEIQILDGNAEPALIPTQIGKIAQENWQLIPKKFPFAELDAFIIMPNHVHGILLLNTPDEGTWKPNAFGPQLHNLAAVIRGYKASVSKFAKAHNLPFAWQARYFDRVIRSEKELQNIRQYILHNPGTWEANQHNPAGILM